MGHSLHIAISARAMSFPFGGVKEFFLDMTRALLRAGEEHRFTLYYSKPDYCGTFPNAEEIALSAPHKFLWDHWALPRRLQRDRPDVVWFPHNVSSLRLCIPTVITVHDLLYFKIPGFAGREYPLLDTLYMRSMMPRSLRKARQIASISNWTAHDVHRLIGIKRDKIHTIYHGTSSHFRKMTSSEVQRFRHDSGLTTPFFFYPGGFSRRKNIPLLLEAFRRVSHKIPHNLVFTGTSGQGGDEIERIIHACGLQNRVVRLGMVSKEKLVCLYNTAEALVYPSRYEGFGLPLVEAFACGCPVISSNASSLAEVAGDAALTFHPNDEETLKNHLESIACNPETRKALVLASLKRAVEFDYSRSAEDLLKLLEHTVSDEKKR
jgi:glycosyltransferase involved in cell wall biosynthesis